MDLDQAMELNYYEVIVEDRQELKELDTLLRRIFGKDAALVLRAKDGSKKWMFQFWATEAEFKVIKTLMEDLALWKLDEEYEELVKNSNGDES